jgi:hypothetical protein
MSYAQREKESLSDFYQKFLQLKPQAPEVSDEQVIAQAIKALRAGPLHSHLVREWPKTISELYDQFTKFSKSEIQYFCKLKQQRKVSKSDEAPRPRYNDNQCNYLKPVHSIDFDGHRPPENWQKSYEGPSRERSPNTFDQRSPSTTSGAQLRAPVGVRPSYTLRPQYCMYNGNETNHRTKDCPIYLDTKRNMDQESTQSSP